MVYTIEEIAEKIRPVAEKYKLPKVWIFGSYARGEANDDSDVDILVDKTGTNLNGIWEMGGLYSDFEDMLHKNIDLTTTKMLFSDEVAKESPFFVESVLKERIQINV
jgi:predicted nucleotidyltransferase